ncbi:Uncharacterized protein SCF082_LOCUS41777, partial [Durusdinium trenchii]
HFPGLAQDLSLLDLAAPPLRRSIGFCTTCKNRLWQLRVALPINLLYAWPFRLSVTLHIVDFGSDGEDTLDFLLRTCRVALDAGLLRVYRVEPRDGARLFHASIAKNTAHAVADEEILVNVDADNICGPGFIEDVTRRFERGVEALHYNTEHVTGTCGRVVLLQKDFLFLGGYDQEAHPMGAQDIDLYLRAGMLAAQRRPRGSREGWRPARETVKDMSLMSIAIPNSLKQKVEHCASQLSWAQMNESNWANFLEKRERQEIIRNRNVQYLGCPVKRIYFVQGDQTVYMVERFIRP